MIRLARMIVRAKDPERWIKQYFNNFVRGDENGVRCQDYSFRRAPRNGIEWAWGRTKKSGTLGGRAIRYWQEVMTVAVSCLVHTSFLRGDVGRSSGLYAVSTEILRLIGPAVTGATSSAMLLSVDSSVKIASMSSKISWRDTAMVPNFALICVPFLTWQSKMVYSLKSQQGKRKDDIKWDWTEIRFGSTFVSSGISKSAQRCLAME
jgi:hypothetical protein